LFEGGYYKPKLVARTGPITFEDAEAPMHRRVSYTSEADSMRVTWTSNQGDSSGVQHVVKWGYTADNLQFTTSATTTTYESDDLCYSPATDVGFINPGFFHSAVLPSLNGTDPEQNHMN
jgi:acid phosphatase type 7